MRVDTTPTIDKIDTASKTLSGKADPNVTIEVRTTNDTTSAPEYSGTADASGNWKINITPQKVDTTLYVVATQDDKISSTAEATVVDATTENDINITMPANNASVLQGTAPVGSQVIVQRDSAKGVQLGAGVATDGTFTITLNDTVKYGDTLYLSSKNTDGSTSHNSFTLTEPELEVKTIKIDKAYPDTVTGTSTKGATVTIIDSTTKKELGVGLVKDDGTFEVNLTTKPAVGTKITATAVLGESSKSADATIIAHATAALATSGDNYAVYGKVTDTKNGAFNDVYVELNGAVVQIATVNADGSYIAALPSSAKVGDNVTVYSVNTDSPDQRTNEQHFVIPPVSVFTTEENSSSVIGIAPYAVENDLVYLYHLSADGKTLGAPAGVGLVLADKTFTIDATAPIDSAQYAVTAGTDKTHWTQITLGSALSGDPVVSTSAKTMTIAADQGTVVTVQSLDNTAYARAQVATDAGATFNLSTLPTNNKTKYLITLSTIDHTGEIATTTHYVYTYKAATASK